ncbi:MAG: alanine--tRNA ligase [Calditrichaeota bacterium]|nr:alanine--tRNA ligase [Calditrichota bacterium]
MNSKEIRQSFLDYFKSKDHKIVPSAPVVPIDDPTLLFTNAGMNQFKKIFLGLEKPDYPRVADSQKCIRVSGKHNDLEEVGKDTYHHTFFEMLGNWSFGDYYKKEAIAFAWELLTEVWKLPKEKLWVTVYKDDDEAEQLWKTTTDVAAGQVLRFGEKENFWEMGETGPCGPCSEIHIDLGPGHCDKQGVPGHVCQVNGDCSRYIELWNLVFIQYNRQEDGSLNELPSRHVDTGMGFERIVAVLQGVPSNYDTDLFQPIIQAISELSGVAYPGPDGGVAHRVIADHVRALSFAIADGALPSNEGRGYVLRRILRRAARYGRKLNMKEPFIYKLVPVLVDVMGEAYPELREKHQFVSMVIQSEEESFGNTLDRGIEIFEKTAADLKKNNQTQFPGFAAFRLYDTYGFPLDLTQLMAEEQGLTVDYEGFEKAMAEQRKRAKEAQKFRYEAHEFFKEGETSPHSEFVGYEKLKETVHLVAFSGNEFLLDKTPFYGESGGQVGDTGVVYTPDGHFRVRVVDTQKSGNMIIHIGKIERGSFEDVKNKELIAEVDRERRKSIARNHTATHLLHKALRTVLGGHVHQAGSLVAPDHLRFDLTHFERIAAEQLDEVERLVNEAVRENYRVEVLTLPYNEAKKLGAVALFGEKYGDIVRVIKIDDYSMEFCGGTHLNFTGEIGYFRILSESSVASGVRRIEAVTGVAADELLRREKHELEALRQKLAATAEDSVQRLEQVLQEKKALEKELLNAQLKLAQTELDSLVQQSEEVDGFKVVANRLPVGTVGELKQIGDVLRSKLKSGVGVLGSEINGKPFLLCVVTDDLIQTKKLKAGDVVKRLGKYIGGGGGGNPRMAQAGGKDVKNLDKALQKTRDVVLELLG